MTEGSGERPPPWRQWRPTRWRRLRERLNFRDEARWHWFEFLIIPILTPLALVIVGVVYTGWLEDRQRDFAKQLDVGQQESEARLAESARTIEDQRAQADALQAYLDQMSQLLLGENNVVNSEDGSVMRRLARARTLTVLERLNPERKTDVMRFLIEARLVQSTFNEDQNTSDEDSITIGPSIDLASTDLSGIDLLGADLTGANLRDANLTDAKLRDATLFYVNLSVADLRGANLTNADLRGTNLREADLSGANLTDADLSCTELPDGTPSCTDLTGVVGISNEELEDQARSLEGATMPDGSKHP